MAKEGKITNSKKVQKHQRRGVGDNISTTKDKKCGWRHIIDKGNYSSGPGDNIYVFG